MPRIQQRARKRPRLPEASQSGPSCGQTPAECGPRPRAVGGGRGAGGLCRSTTGTQRPGTTPLCPAPRTLGTGGQSNRVKKGPELSQVAEARDTDPQQHPRGVGSHCPWVWGSACVGEFTFPVTPDATPPFRSRSKLWGGADVRDEVT